MFTASRLRALSALVIAVCAPGAAAAACTGDCNGGGTVTVNELVTGVNISLGTAPISACEAFDGSGNGKVEVNELVAGVNNSLRGCPATPTPEETATTTPQSTATGTTGATETLTPTFASTATITATAGATNTHTAAPTPTETGAATATHTAMPTDTPPGATATATASLSPSPSATPTPTSSGEVPSLTPTATATMGTSAVCGNSLLEPGESCESCADDCTVESCTATATMLTFQVIFNGPPGTFPITTTTLLAYRSDHVSIPGSANVLSVRQRVTLPAPLPNVLSINDLDYAARVVVGRSAGLSNGLLYSVKVDACQGAPAITAADFACTMEACAGSGGPIADCTCTVVAP